MAQNTPPDDINALKALLEVECSARASAEVKADRERERADRLEKLLAELRRALYGRRSERLDPEQFQLALEDLEAAIAGVDMCSGAETPEVDAKSRRRKSNRGSLPKHLPREEVIIEPSSTMCSCGACMQRIGEDRSERLDVIPAQYRVIVTIRPKYACQSCQDGVVQAPAPVRLIEGGLPTEALIAQVLINKYADHLPLYRQAQIMARQGIELDRSTLADWVGRAAFELRPVFERLAARLRTSSKLIIDELGFVPLSKTGAELLFEVFSQRYERGSIMVTSNLPFDEWTEIFGSERLTGALLDRLTHHVHILEMNGDSYRLNQSRKQRKSPKTPA